MSRRDRIEGVRRRPAGLTAEEDPFLEDAASDSGEDSSDGEGHTDELNAEEAGPGGPSISTSADSFRRRAKGTLFAASVLLPIEELIPSLDGLRSQEAVVARFASDFVLLREQLSGGPETAPEERAHRWMEFFLQYAAQFVALGDAQESSERRHAARAFRRVLEEQDYGAILEARSRRAAPSVAEALLALPTARELWRRSRTLSWAAPSWSVPSGPGESIDSPATQLLSAHVTEPELPAMRRPADPPSAAPDALFPKGGAGLVLGTMFVLGLFLMLLVLFIL